MATGLVSMFLLFSFSCAVWAKFDYSPEQYLQNYALATCISQGFPGKEIKDDAAAAARGYLEFGDYSLAAYTAVRKLGKEFLSKAYQSESEQPMITAKCIDFYHSHELAELIWSYKGKTDD